MSVTPAWGPRRRFHLRLVGPDETAPGITERAAASAGIQAIEQRIGSVRARFLVAADPVAVAAIVASDPLTLLARLEALTGTPGGVA
jgi:hypothetical protein